MNKSNATFSGRSGGRRRQSQKGNTAFIDSQNLHLSIRDAGWKLDLMRFRVYLREKYDVDVAYLFMGYMEEYQDLYLSLQKDGFIIIYKDILRTKDGTVKGNVDAELVLQAMIDYPSYQRAVIVTGDGDFACLVRYLEKNDKLETLLVPNQRKYSSLLNKAAGKRIAFVSDLRQKLGYKGRGAVGKKAQEGAKDAQGGQGDAGKAQEIRGQGRLSKNALEAPKRRQDAQGERLSEERRQSQKAPRERKNQHAQEVPKGRQGARNVRLGTKTEVVKSAPVVQPEEASAPKKTHRRGHRGGRGRRPKSDQAE